MKKEKNLKCIDDYRIIRPATKEGETCSHWLDIDGTDHLYKIESLYKGICEIFCGLILKKINIPTVSYYLASYHHTIGVITPTYNQELIKKYKQYLFDNYRYIDSNIWCVEKVKKVLTWYYPDLSEEIYENLYNGLFIQFMASIFLANSDLNQKNIEIYETDQPNISPCFDFGYSFNISFGKMNINPYFFKYTSYYLNDLSHEFEKPRTTISKFLQFGDRKHIEIFKAELEKLKNVNFSQIIEIIEAENEYIIPEQITKKIHKLYTKNIKEIDCIVKSTK